jgi:hypothetical protein
MKRYVSLAGAMLLGTVVANEKASALKSDIAAKIEAVELKEAHVALETKKPVYRSEASPIQDVEIVNNEAESSCTSVDTSKSVQKGPKRSKSPQDLYVWERDASKSVQKGPKRSKSPQDLYVWEKDEDLFVEKEVDEDLYVWERD